MFPLLIIASLFSFALAQILSLRPENPFSNALVEHTTQQQHQQQPHRQHRQYHRYTSPPQPETDLFDNIDLLDIILLASVDGKFHALNRTSGHILWSMGPYPSSSSSSSSQPQPSGPTALSPLVRTSHIDYDPEITDDSAPQEIYIIEPQSGDIYVMPNPSSPLQRFPFTMQELVDMSPFSFSGEEEDGRVFVGKKETSLLVVELETGRIKATLNSECPWDQFEEFRKGDEDELDLDQLEGNEPQKPQTTDVYIGRTDYHVSIITRPNPSSSSFRPSSSASRSNLIQNLSFSTYGPNRQDNHLQSLYRRTKDDAYVQPLPGGEIMSFRAKSTVDGSGQQTTMNHDPLWGHDFPQPIVAVFDVMRKRSPVKSKDSSSSLPFVLLQPRPKIQDLIPNLPASVKDNLRTAYVGLVSETGSLFAMSPQNFPLVVFSRHEEMKNRLIDSGPRHGPSRVKLSQGRAGAGRKEEEDEAKTVDELTKLRKLREAAGQEEGEGEEVIECHDKIMNDRRCLVGVRRLELDTGDGTQTRMKRLLDAAPSAMAFDDYRRLVADHPHSESPAQWDEGGNESRGSGALMIDPPPSPLSIEATRAGIVVEAKWWEVVSVMVVLGFVTFWMVVRGETWRKALGIKKNVSRLDSRAQAVEVKEDSGKVTGPEVSDTIPSTTTIPKDISPPIPATPDTPTPGSLTPTPTPAPIVASAGGEETDKEDLEGTNTDVEDFIVVADPGSGSGSSGLNGNGIIPGTPATPKKKTRRGKRGAKKSKNAADPEQVNGKEQEAETRAPQSSLIVTSSVVKPSVAPSPSLIVSDTVLGYGSHGTVVYRGSLQGRAVAVKRLLADFVTLASREVSILQESDDHPNVIRYYYQESHAGFLYIALELCPASLADIVETPDRDAWRDIAVNFDPKRALRQVTNGLRHLHGLKLVHRDIKPHNILVSTKGVGGMGGAGGSGGGGVGAGGRGASYRMLISDFGLCKKLDVDQTSFLPTANGAMAAGTVGWRAPEILSGEVKLNEFADDSSRGSTATVQGNNASISSTSSTNSNVSAKGRTRLTKSVDIFALGCLYYYTLTGGGHPFGDRYEREVNIMKNEKNLEMLERFGEEGTEAMDLIERMLDPLPTGRPDTTSCLLHPFFWDSSRRLNFLQDASDRFEIMCRDPRDPNLVALEEGAFGVVGNDWVGRLDKVFIENLGKFRKYDKKSVQDLLRALRNKKHHYQDLPDNVKRHLGPMPEGYLAYFTRRFPNLFLHVHRVVKETGLADESMFRSYFELPDS